MFSKLSIFILSVICISFPASAQEVLVKGIFQAHRAKIGEPVPYSLSVHHPTSQSFVFPDSTYSFAPFELNKKVYFPTRTTGGISVDSAVYDVSNFEIDSVQLLALPVFAVNRVDCTAFYPHADTLFISTIVKSPPPPSVEAKDLPLKTNADYLNVRWLLNYPMLLVIAGVLLVLLIVAWIIFGKQIRRYFLLRKLNRNHAAFLQRFSDHIEKLKAGSAYAEAETALVDWKKYMEGLIAKPFTKFTTKEILVVAADDILGQALHDIDRMVYAGTGSSPDAFERLRHYSQDQFTRKTEEVKHG